MPEERSLEGWVPVLSEDLSLERVIDLAFDYRGNTTIVKRDGAEIVAYIFNRDGQAPEPYVEYFDEKGDGPFSLPYSEIANIKFTGKDASAGRSWEAWVRRREIQKAKGQAWRSGDEA